MNQYTNQQIEYRRISSIDFSILSPQDMLKISTVSIDNAELYKQANQPVKNGPLDLKMGVGNKIMQCATCGFKLQQCVGHFGHFGLSLPIYHIGYFKHLLVILKMVCKYCSNIMLTSKSIKEHSQKMNKIKSNYINRCAYFKKISKEASKSKNCPHCLKLNPNIQKIPKVAAKMQVRHPQIKRDMVEQMIKRGAIDSYPKIAKQFIYELNPWQAKSIIKKIPSSQYLLLNIGDSNNVLNLIIENIIVPPVCIRPSVMLTNSLSNQDDLTIKIKQMVFLNKKISENMIQKGQEYQKINKAWYLLQSHWSQYINSDAPGLPLLQLKNKYIRSLCTRLKGKQGRFRQNLSGKRSNYTARTVISPDPNLHPTEVNIPEIMSKILTISENVTQYSIQRLQQCIEKGNNERGGANFVIKANGQKIMLGIYTKGKINLQLGDKVQRHLHDGDYVIFNRQPSLHRMSMMGFKAKIYDGKTLRFNQCNCAPFNADFDGDEMNIHVPQTLQSRSQTKHLLGVASNIITPKSGQPIIALIQDFLTVSFLITNKQIFFHRDQFCQILSWITDADELINLPAPTILKPVCLWTGKQIISCILRPNKLSKVMVNLQTKQKIYTENKYLCLRDGWVLFRNSQLLLGRIGKSTLGGNKTGLIYALLRDNTPLVACQIMHRFAKLSARWLSNFGMTMGINDVTPSSTLSHINKQEINTAYFKYQEYMLSFSKGQLEAKPGMSQKQTLQSNINQTLSKVRETVGDNCISHLGKCNKPLIMALCGSKGNAVNLSQMIGCVGQQTVGGKRITYGFTERSLPHFARLEETPQARGFVKNSFYSGLTAIQFFFHTMGGRQGIIDTAVKTADTGYMQRRLIKLIEDLTVMYDYTVRTCDRRDIIQFRYGDDGLDPMKTQQSSNPINLQSLQRYVKSLLGNKIYSKEFIQPSKMMDKVQKYIEIMKQQKLIVGLQEGYLQCLFNKLRTYFKNKTQKLEINYSREQFLNVQDNDYYHNCWNGMTENQFDFFFKLYVNRLNRCILQPGQVIGALTAQSIGQPATQMTLKTFHFAGISSMNITQGVPRVNQIINNTKNIATPIITINIQDSSKNAAIKVRNSIQKMTFDKVIHYIEQIYEIAECKINIIINLKTIQKLQLHITIQQIKNIIDRQLRTKIKKSTLIDAKTISLVPIVKTNMIFQLKSLRSKLVCLKIGGISTINRALISKDETGKHVLFAQGLGLSKVMCKRGVDTINTFSNHITEIEECLGIQAARQSIINQIGQTMKQHGVSVNPRHINLLAQTMCVKGKIIGFTRNGVDKMKDSPLMLASFQKTTDFLFDAASQGRHDRMKGISEKIIMGQPITVGTGMLDIKQDINKTIIYGK